MQLPLINGSKTQIDNNRFQSDQHPLTSMTLMVTEQCNLRCSYCYIRKQPRKMTPAIAERAFEFLMENSTPKEERLNICFFGGEPLLEPKLIRHVCEYSRTPAASANKKMGFSMTTNATMVSDKRLDLLLEFEIATTVSLDGVGTTHDLHRKTVSGRGSFHLIQSNIDRIRQIPGVRIRLTVTPETASSLCDSVEWILNQGFKRVSISPVIEADWDEKSLGDYFDSWSRLYELQRALTLSGAGNRQIADIQKTDRRLKSTGEREFGCGAARNMVTVDAKGNLYPCHRYVGYFRNAPEQQIGHVDTGFDVSKREYYIASNALETHQGCGSGMFSEEQPPAQICSNCSLSSLCGTSCMAVNEYVTGSPRNPPPINRVLSQIHVSIHMDNELEDAETVARADCSAY